MSSSKVQQPTGVPMTMGIEDSGYNKIKDFATKALNIPVSVHPPQKEVPILRKQTKPVSTQKSPWIMFPINDEDSKVQLPLGKSIWGRSNGAFQKKIESTRVSRQHLELNLVGQDIYAKQLGSNSTRIINGEFKNIALKKGAVEQLHHGDRLYFDSTNKEADAFEVKFTTNVDKAPTFKLPTAIVKKGSGNAKIKLAPHISSTTAMEALDEGLVSPITGLLNNDLRHSDWSHVHTSSLQTHELHVPHDPEVASEPSVADGQSWSGKVVSHQMEDNLKIDLQMINGGEGGKVKLEKSGASTYSSPRTNNVHTSPRSPVKRQYMMQPGESPRISQKGELSSRRNSSSSMNWSKTGDSVLEMNKVASPECSTSTTVAEVKPENGWTRRLRSSEDPTMVPDPVKNRLQLPRVGNDYQAILPELLAHKPKVMVKPGKQEKGSLSAWSMALHAESSDEEKTEKLEELTPEQLKAFETGMRNCLKDFYSMRRNLEELGEFTTGQLVYYYYKHWKLTEGYKQWKKWSSGETNDKSPPTLRSDNNKQISTNEKETNAPVVKTDANPFGSLSDMINAGLLKPGKNVLTVKYLSHSQVADLKEDGKIVYQGKEYSTVSGFSLECKRKYNPNLRADNGWSSIHYKGQNLSKIRKKAKLSGNYGKFSDKTSINGGKRVSKEEVQDDDNRKARIADNPEMYRVLRRAKDVELSDLLQLELISYGDKKLRAVSSNDTVFYADILEDGDVSCCTTGLLYTRISDWLLDLVCDFEVENLSSDEMEKEDESDDESQHSQVVETVTIDKLVYLSAEEEIESEKQVKDLQLEYVKLVSFETEEEQEEKSPLKEDDTESRRLPRRAAATHGLSRVMNRVKMQSSDKKSTDVTEGIPNAKRKLVSDTLVTKARKKKRENSVSTESEMDVVEAESEIVHTTVSSRKKDVYCCCQVADEYSSDPVFLQCSKATSKCRGWIHPSCFGMDLSIKEMETTEQLVCPLCSGDGLEPNGKKPKKVMYSVDTKIRKVLHHNGLALGWFKGIVKRVNPKSNRPYLVYFAFNESEEWTNFKKNDANVMLESDWQRCVAFQRQDENWRHWPSQSSRNVRSHFP